MSDGRIGGYPTAQRRAPSVRELELEVLRRRKPARRRPDAPGRWIAHRLERLSEVLRVAPALPAAV